MEFYCNFSYCNTYRSYKFQSSPDSSLDLSRRKGLQANHTLSDKFYVSKSIAFSFTKQEHSHKTYQNQQSPFYQQKLNLWDFSLLLAFSFTLHTPTKPTDASVSRIIALKMQPSRKIWKPMKYIRRHIKSNSY